MNKTLKRCVRAALLAALLCVVSPFAIPVFGVPLTLSVAAVFMICFISDNIIDGLLPIVLYIALGALGLPVFSGMKSGIGALLSPTGGFIFGYIICAALCLTLQKCFCSKIPPALISLASLYLCGTLWYCFIMRAGFFSGLYVCVLPFIVPDILKILFALFVSKKLKNALGK
jgi:biotin transport system substrate-specific component